MSESKNQALDAALNELERVNAIRTRLHLAAKDVLDARTSTFRARNGRDVGIEDQHGEKCWIVPFDLMALLEGALEAEGGGWLDISTAPKDGSHFLACDARIPYGPQWGFDQRPPTVVHWWGNPGEEGFYTSVNEFEPQEPFAATHWQPLSAPPANHKM